MSDPTYPAGPPGRVSWPLLAASWLVAGCLCWTPPARSEDLADLPLERLMATEVVSAANFARQITDAASAVSVLTAEDIRVYGLRTLGEVLDQMRGLHISHSTDYVYVGARGIGGPGTFAGRVLLLIDGIPAVDNLYDQLYLGHDSPIDVALVERVEYAPGSGSAIYGNNAFLGVINVVTKRGRDFEGLQASATLGEWADRSARLSGGRRHANGAEWLASLTLHRDSGVPSSEVGHLIDGRTGRDYQFFFKGHWQGFSLEAMDTLRRNVGHPSWGVHGYSDHMRLLTLGHDGTLGTAWRTSTRLHLGRYGYRLFDDDLEYGPYRGADDGTWWSLDSQASYDGWAGHRIVVGGRVRFDPMLRSVSTDYDGSIYGSSNRRRSTGLSVEDAVALAPGWQATLGLRLDRRNGTHWTPGPRVALIWEPAPRWNVKLSQGRTTRFASMSEQLAAAPTEQPREQANTTELVTEYQRDSLRLLSSLYHYRVNNLISEIDAVRQLRGHGLELEAEWQWHGWRVRGSQAWQQARAGMAQSLSYSPRSVSKLQVSAPLVGESLRASLALRRTGAYANFSGDNVPSRTLVDLTLVSRNVAAGMDLRLGWRNLFKQPNLAMQEYFTESIGARPSRQAWIELSRSFR